MTINKIQVEFRKGQYSSIWTGVIAFDRPKNENIWFWLNNLSFNDPILLKVMGQFGQEL